MEGQVAIPDEVWINGRTYEIEDCSGPAADAEALMGQLRYHGARILLNMDMDLEAQLRTLWHEMWHVFAHDMGMEPADDRAEVEKMAELVSLFAHVVLCHNRELADAYCTHSQEEEED